MSKAVSGLLLVLTLLLHACATNEQTAIDGSATAAPAWTAGADVEAFWLQYADSKGGLTWGASTHYPEYTNVKEGDTFLVQLEQGPCLMEFFHSRWRLANDVRRWDAAMNSYGGCPYVLN